MRILLTALLSAVILCSYCFTQENAVQIIGKDKCNDTKAYSALMKRQMYFNDFEMSMMKMDWKLGKYVNVKAMPKCSGLNFVGSVQERGYKSDIRAK